MRQICHVTRFKHDKITPTLLMSLVTPTHLTPHTWYLKQSWQLANTMKHQTSFILFSSSASEQFATYSTYSIISNQPNNYEFFVFILERMLQGAPGFTEVHDCRHVVLLHLFLPDKLQVGVSYPAPDVIALLTNVY